MKHHRITYYEKGLEETINPHDIKGLRVLSKEGSDLGKVSSIRINLSNHKVEGIVIKRGILKKPAYIGLSYIARITDKAVLLNIDPYFLLKGKRVINNQGKHLGRIKDIQRTKHTNNTEQLTIRSITRKETNIHPNEIAILGEKIILKTNKEHDTKKKK